jgi:hypothetical protein
MIPLYDGIPTRRFPIVNVAIIVANFAVGEALLKSSYAQAKKREPSPKTVGNPQALR